MRALERTIAIIKPDVARDTATCKRVEKQITERGLTILVSQRVRLEKSFVESFYAEHAEKPFFDSLIAYMTRGPVVVMLLEGSHAITSYRELMGATDPKEAQRGTLRSQFGTDKGENGFHGSADHRSASREIHLVARSWPSFPVTDGK